MFRFIARRILVLIPLLLIVLTLTFALIRFAPGSPFTAEGEREVPAQVRKQLEQQFGMNNPLAIQYWNYLKGVVRGDLGPSLRLSATSVNEIIARSAGPSVILGLSAYLLALAAGLTLGIFAALRPRSPIDFLSMFVAMIGVSVPNFVLGPILVIIFSLTLYWLPPARWGDLRHLILPAVTLSAVYTAYIARLVRSGMLEALSQDYIRTARAKGLKTWTVVMRHALPQAILPVVSFTGPALAFLLTGTVVVERIFAIPGLGAAFIAAADSRDYFVVMGVVLVSSTALILMNLLVDIAYAAIDPRINYE